MSPGDGKGDSTSVESPSADAMPSGEAPVLTTRLSFWSGLAAIGGMSLAVTFRREVTESMEDRLALLLWLKRTDAALDLLREVSKLALEACGPEIMDKADGPLWRLGRIT